MNNQQEMASFTYDAFISYRHTKLDMMVAETLHKQLESYKIPKPVIERVGKNKINRVFRDRDELPTTNNLADSILDALKNSGYLIVICSPRTPESKWVVAEIENFKKIHGEGKILALLIEGEPRDSFPDALRYMDQEIIDENGHKVIKKVEVEPLAADIRAATPIQMKRLLKNEILRVVATIIGCRFDDLKQRHKERKKNRWIRVSLGLMIFFAVFGLIASYQALTIRNQRDDINSQNIALEIQNKEIDEKNDVLLVQNDLIEEQNIHLQEEINHTLIGESKYLSNISAMKLDAGDRQKAMLFALEALPKDPSNPDRPYVEEAEYALSRATDLYKTNHYFYGEQYMSHDMSIGSFDLTEDGSKLLSVCDDGYIYLWDVASGLQLNSWYYHKDYLDSTSNQSTFINDDQNIVSITADGLVSWNIETGDEDWFVEGAYNELVVNDTKDIIVATTYSDLFVFNKEGESVGSIDYNSTIYKVEVSEDGKVIATATVDDMIHLYFVQDTEKNFSIAYDYDLLGGLELDSTGRRLVIYNYDVGMDGPESLRVMNTITRDYTHLLDISNTGILKAFKFVGMDENYLSFAEGSNCHIYDLENSETLSILPHASTVNVTDLSKNDPDILFTGTSDGVIRIWNVATGMEYDSYRVETAHNISQLEKAGDTMFTTNVLTNDIYVFKSNYAYEYVLLESESTNTVSKMLFSPDGTMFVVVRYEAHTIYLYDTESNMLLREIVIEEKTIDYVDFINDGSSLLIFYDDDSVIKYGIDSQAVDELSLKEGDYKYKSSENGLNLIATSFDSIIVTDLESGTVIYEKDVNNYKNALKISPDNTYVAEADGYLKVINIETKASIIEMEENDYSQAIWLTNDTLATIHYGLTEDAGEYAIVDLWNVLQGTLIHSFEVEKNQEAEFLTGNALYVFLNLSSGRIMAYDYEGNGQLVDEFTMTVESGAIQANRLLLKVSWQGNYIYDLDSLKRIQWIPYTHDIDISGGHVLNSNNYNAYVMPYYDLASMISAAKSQLAGRTLSDAERNHVND